MIKLFTSFYLFSLAASAMGVFLLGAMVAPIIFHSEVVFGVKLLGRYDAGLMMSEIFSRFNYVLLTTAAITIAFEGFLAVNKKNSKTMLGISFINVAAIGLYAFILTPQIIGYQAMGEEALTSKTFETVHKIAEFDFKLLLVTLIVAFFMRMSTVLPCNIWKEKRSND
ncbi:MAG: DUF4149 domain-containing protein [Campylobacteraceae bacterium]|jgi:hypothetical protein|nr:DUF4149 domain-containing protein [Campylobacteraceae bacterium]